MSANLIQSASAASGTAGAGKTDAISQALGGSELGQMFTKLLVAQVKYQNPLEPTDSSAFISQLSQLSQTESLQGLTAQMKAQSSILDSLQTMQLGGQVGSTVVVATDSVQLGGEPQQALVNLSAGADLTLTLTDSTGKKTTVPLGQQQPGDVPLAIDPQKLGLPAGRYQVAVRDADGRGYPVEVAGRLNSVRMTTAGVVALQVQGVGEIQPAQVSRFLGQPQA